MPKEGVVLVTGAAKRLGRAIALDLAEAGWDVAVHYGGSSATAEETVAAIRALGRRAVAIGANLADAAQTRDVIPAVVAALGPVRALVNNASVFEHDDIATMTDATWAMHIDVNLRAPVLLAQSFSRTLPEGMDGAIVNLLDQRLFKPTPQFLSYGVSKAGLHWLTVTLAQALAPRIRVNAVAPGPTLRNARQSEAHFKRQTAATILGRGASPADIAGATRYLLNARAVTGQTIVVDGGQHLIWRTADIEGIAE